MDAVWVSGREDKPERTFQPSIAALARQARSPKKNPQSQITKRLDVLGNAAAKRG